MRTRWSALAVVAIIAVAVVGCTSGGDKMMSGDRMMSGDKMSDDKKMMEKK
jgi:hypothetical protein